MRTMRREKTMEQVTDAQHRQARSKRQLGSRLVPFAFLAIGGFFLITAHTAHLFGILPYLLVLLCPLLHLLHGGHGSKHDTESRHTDGEKQ